MLLHYLGKFKIRKFALFMHVRRFNVSLYHLYNRYLSNVTNIQNKCKDSHYAKYQHFTFCSFTVLNKLRRLKLSKVGLSTIKCQYSKKSDMMDRSHLNQKDMKNCKCVRVCSRKVFKMSTICTDTCLEMRSSLVNCSVNNVRSEIGP